MAFKTFEHSDSPNGTAHVLNDDDGDAPPPPRSVQLALRLADTMEIAPVPRAARASPQEIKGHIAHLSGQIEALRQQLSQHSADRIAFLIREMIEEREQALERWMVQEEAWDRRVAAIESAISERDAFREREAALVRERDEARRAAATAAATAEMAQRAAEQARRDAADVHRAAEHAKAEQLRLRAEREIDRTTWGSERRQLAARLKGIEERGWLSRLLGAT